MRLLVEEGGAFINVTDRWGNTPLDEANRSGARPCAAFLEKRIAAQQRGEKHYPLNLRRIWVSMPCEILPNIYPDVSACTIE
jgi:ankyrin repeat protein